MEPYPCSLRIVNLIKWSINNSINDKRDSFRNITFSKSRIMWKDDLEINLKEGMILKIPKYLLNFDLNEKSNFSDSTFLKKSIKLALLAPFRISEIELQNFYQKRISQISEFYH